MMMTLVLIVVAVEVVKKNEIRVSKLPSHRNLRTHLSSFMKRFFNLSSSEALTVTQDQYQHTRRHTTRLTVGPLLHVLHEL